MVFKPTWFSIIVLFYCLLLRDNKHMTQNNYPIYYSLLKDACLQLDVVDLPRVVDITNLVEFQSEGSANVSLDFWDHLAKHLDPSDHLQHLFLLKTLDHFVDGVFNKYSRFLGQSSSLKILEKQVSSAPKVVHIP